MSKKQQFTGETIDFTVSGSAVSSGDGYLHGAIFGIIQGDAAVGETATLMVVGSHTVDKDTGFDPAVGTVAYWDDTAKEFNVSASGRFPVGVWHEAPAASAATGIVRLNGSHTTAVA